MATPTNIAAPAAVTTWRHYFELTKPKVVALITFTAIVGTLPIAIGVGTSAASRRPLGIAVVGGLAFSQVVTLFVTPVFYSYFDQLQSWLGRRAARAVAAEPVPAAGD